MGELGGEWCRVIREYNISLISPTFGDFENKKTLCPSSYMRTGFIQNSNNLPPHLFSCLYSQPAGQQARTMQFNTVKDGRKITQNVLGEHKVITTEQ